METTVNAAGPLEASVRLRDLPPEGTALRKLGARLSELLDENQWAECERMLFDVADANPWIRAGDRLPKPQQQVLIAYVSDHGRPVVTMGWYTPAKTLESSSFEGEVDDEYDDEKDCYYLKEQWVDESQESEYQYLISRVTHWMPMPALPPNYK